MIKQIKIKKFRNIHNEIELGSLEDFSRNLTIYSTMDGYGKDDIFSAIKKALGYAFFTDIDFLTDDNSPIEVEFSFDQIEFQDKTYNDFVLKVQATPKQFLFPIISNNSSIHQNDALPKALIKNFKAFLELMEKNKDEFTKIFRKYFLQNSKNYSSVKRNHLLINESDSYELLLKQMKKINRKNIFNILELFMALNKSIASNRKGRYQAINEYISNGHFDHDVEEFEREFIQALVIILDEIQGFWEIQLQNNINLYAFKILRDKVNFVSDTTQIGKTVNLVDNSIDWLSEFLKLFNSSKQELFIKLKESTPEDEKVIKIRSKLKKFFEYYLELIEDKNIQIKDVRIIPVTYHEQNVIVIRIIDQHDHSLNFEQFGSSFLSFFLLIPVISKNNQQSIFFIPNLANNFPKRTKDRLLKFIAKDLKSKVIYTTNYLTDKERFEKYNDLLLLDPENFQNLDSLKEIALMQKLNELKQRLSNYSDSFQTPPLLEPTSEDKFKFDSEPTKEVYLREFNDKILNLHSELALKQREIDVLVKKLEESKHNQELIQEDLTSFISKEYKGNHTSSEISLFEGTQDDPPNDEQMNISKTKYFDMKENLLRSQRELTKVSFDHSLLLNNKEDSPLEQNIVVTENQITHHPTHHHVDNEETTEIQIFHDSHTHKLNELKTQNKSLSSKLESLNKDLSDLQEVNKAMVYSSNIQVNDQLSNNDHSKKDRLIFSTALGNNFLKWIINKEKILLVEYNYHFSEIPSTKDEINATLALALKTKYEQIYILSNYNNEAKRVFASPILKDIKKEYRLSQLKPYYWNMNRHSNIILNEKIPEIETFSIKNLMVEGLRRSKIIPTEDDIKSMNMLQEYFDSHEHEYKEFLREFELNKLIKILKQVL